MALMLEQTLHPLVQVPPNLPEHDDCDEENGPIQHKPDWVEVLLGLTHLTLLYPWLPPGT